MAIELNVTPEAFTSEVEKYGDKQVIIDFWAAWCGPCRALSPVLDKIEEENEDVVVLKVNVDDNPEISQALRIQSIPALMFFKNGEVNASPMVGVAPKHVILENIKNG